VLQNAWAQNLKEILFTYCKYSHAMRDTQRRSSLEVRNSAMIAIKKFIVTDDATRSGESIFAGSVTRLCRWSYCTDGSWAPHSEGIFACFRSKDCLYTNELFRRRMADSGCTNLSGDFGIGNNSAIERFFSLQMPERTVRKTVIALGRSLGDT
jgi:hypothetical protein